MTVMMSSESYKGLPVTVEEAQEQVVLANRILSNEGVLDAFGHVSVRHPGDPNRFLQSRSLAPELVTKNDILEIDLEGKVLTRTDMKPYGERIIHAAIFKARPDVNAVFHGHPHQVIPFSCTGVPLRPIAHFAAMFYKGIPLFDDYDVSTGMLIVSPEQGERVARALGSARALLMRGHGCVVVGEHIPAVVSGSIRLRNNATIQLQALALGQPKYLSFEEAREETRLQLSQVVLEREWTYWVARAKRAMPDL
jgi:3-hydroxy-2-methylpyridine-4,5-dicarboxylate 4-decarboxylase